MSSTGTSALQSKFTRYTLKQRIGAGGMATVYQAWDNNLERDVAIKVLHEHLAFDNTFQERFEREAKFVAGFHHPHIVQIFDFAVIPDDDIPLYYMVMPLLTGAGLDKIISNYRQNNDSIPNEIIINLIREISSALDYAHARGMIHRDVKPANILYDDYNHAILTDFGIARLAEASNLTGEGVTVGTPAYMPPEQAQGLEIDHRADIYSLGVIAYEMVTGMPPYGEGSVSVMLQHINAPIPQVSDHLDTENKLLDAVITKVLAKHPEDRYQSATAFAIDLSHALNGEPVSAPQQPTKILETAETTTETDRPVYVETYPKRKQGATFSSPLGLLAMGLGLIAFVLVIALLSQKSAPSVTPNVGATQSASENVADSMTGDFFFSTSFEADDPMLASWDQTDTQFVIRDITNNQYVITNRRANTATTSLFDPAYTYDNVVITIDAHLVNAESLASGYGIVFNYVDPENYNVFAVDGRGRFSIWVREAGQWKELRDADAKWTENQAVNIGTASNTVTIELYDNTITGLVNGIEVTQVKDDTLAEGAIGIYLATTPQGEATVEVDNFTITNNIIPATSMTDDSEDTTESMTGNE